MLHHNQYRYPTVYEVQSIQTGDTDGEDRVRFGLGDPSGWPMFECSVTNWRSRVAVFDVVTVAGESAE